MSTIKSIIIPYVESQYNHEYIANIFWNQGLARIKKITLIPSSVESYSKAYILIDSWGEHEFVEPFIKRLKNPVKHARIMHDEDEWWTIIPHDNCDLNYGIYTVEFDRDYYTEEEDDEHIFFGTRIALLAIRFALRLTGRNIDL